MEFPSSSFSELDYQNIDDLNAPSPSPSFVSIILEVLIISVIAGVVLFFLVNLFETKALVVAAAGSAINPDQSERLKTLDEKVLDLRLGVKKISTALELLINDRDFTEKEREVRAAGKTLGEIKNTLDFITSKLPQDEKDVRAATKSAKDLRDQIQATTFEEKLDAYESLVNGASTRLKTLKTRYATPFVVQDKRFTSTALRKRMDAENKNTLRIELSIQIGDDGSALKTTLMFPTPRDKNAYVPPVVATNEPILGPSPDPIPTGKYFVLLDFANKLAELNPTAKKMGSGLISCVATSLVGVDPLNLKLSKITCVATGLVTESISGDPVMLFPPIPFNRSDLTSGLRLEAAYPGNYVVSVVLSLA